MFKISKDQRDAIINVVQNSDIPTKIGVQVIAMLQKLEEIKEDKKEDKK